HEVNVMGGEVEITCKATFDRQSDGWFIFHNEYLGRLMMRNDGIHLKTGCEYRVKCREAKKEYDFSPHETNAFWCITSVIEAMYTPRKSMSVDSTPQASLSRYSVENEWTTVMITGSHYNNWFGSCSGADIIRIPYSLNLHAGPLEVGALFRMKYVKKEAGHFYAVEMDPTRITRNDFKVETRAVGIEMWCISRIVSSNKCGFVVFNDVIGDAILPSYRVDKRVRVGDWLETLCYRVRNKDQFTDWRVRTTRIAKLQNESSGDGERFITAEKDPSIKFATSWGSNKLKMEGSMRGEEEEEEVTSEKVDKKRAVLDMMHYFLSIPSIRKKFVHDGSANRNKVLRILERDRNRSNQA
ncbi:hypothetical protein PFISCL1PPCAC_16271, partial [Pristionchus fissidentatus]